MGSRGGREGVDTGTVRVALKRLHPAAVPPKRMTDHAAGHDLVACLGEGESVVVAAGGRAMLPTGWALAIPPGFEGQVRPRSGLAWREGVTVLNAPGTIDADYRGELKVLLLNTSDQPVRISHGDRIGQLVIAPVVAAQWDFVEALPGDTDPGRGAGGFGSTGQ